MFIRMLSICEGTSDQTTYPAFLGLPLMVAVENGREAKEDGGFSNLYRRYL